MNNPESKIYDLLEAKSFDELTPEEKKLVLDELGSKDTYEQMREMMTIAEEDDESPPIPKQVKGAVMEAFDAEHGEGKKRIAWWKYAAAIAVLIVGAWILWPNGELRESQLAENKTPAEQKVEEEKADEGEPNPDDQAERKIQEESAKPDESSGEPADSQIGQIAEAAENKEFASDESGQDVITDADMADDNEAQVFSELQEESAAEELATTSPDSEKKITQNEEVNLAKAGNRPENDRAVSVSSFSEVDAATKSRSSVSAGLTLNTLGGPLKDAYVSY